MATQCREHGIIVQSLLPGVLATKMSSLPPSILIPDAETYVTTSLRTLGIEARTAGYWMHKIMVQHMSQLLSKHSVMVDI